MKDASEYTLHTLDCFASISISPIELGLVFCFSLNPMEIRTDRPVNFLDPRDVQ